jgi:hypothetical protein
MITHMLALNIKYPNGNSFLNKDLSYNDSYFHRDKNEKNSRFFRDHSSSQMNNSFQQKETELSQELQADEVRKQLMLFASSLQKNSALLFEGLSEHFPNIDNLPLLKSILQCDGRFVLQHAGQLTPENAMRIEAMKVLEVCDKYLKYYPEAFSAILQALMQIMEQNGFNGISNLNKKTIAEFMQPIKWPKIQSSELQPVIQWNQSNPKTPLSYNLIKCTTPIVNKIIEECLVDNKNNNYLKCIEIYDIWNKLPEVIQNNADYMLNGIPKAVVTSIMNNIVEKYNNFQNLYTYSDIELLILTQAIYLNHDNDKLFAHTRFTIEILENIAILYTLISKSQLQIYNTIGIGTQTLNAVSELFLLTEYVQNNVIPHGSEWLNTINQMKESELLESFKNINNLIDSVRDELSNKNNDAKQMIESCTKSAEDLLSKLKKILNTAKKQFNKCVEKLCNYDPKLPSQLKNTIQYETVSSYDQYLNACDTTISALKQVNQKCATLVQAINNYQAQLKKIYNEKKIMFDTQQRIQIYTEPFRLICMLVKQVLLMIVWPNEIVKFLPKQIGFFECQKYLDDGEDGLFYSRLNNLEKLAQILTFETNSSNSSSEQNLQNILCDISIILCNFYHDSLNPITEFTQNKLRKICMRYMMKYTGQNAKVTSSESESDSDSKLNLDSLLKKWKAYIVLLMLQKYYQYISKIIPQLPEIISQLISLTPNRTTNLKNESTDESANKLLYKSVFDNLLAQSEKLVTQIKKIQLEKTELKYSEEPITDVLNKIVTQTICRIIYRNKDTEELAKILKCLHSSVIEIHIATNDITNIVQQVIKKRISELNNAVQQCVPENNEQYFSGLFSFDVSDQSNNKTECTHMVQYYKFYHKYNESIQLTKEMHQKHQNLVQEAQSLQAILQKDQKNLMELYEKIKENEKSISNGSEHIHDNRNLFCSVTNQTEYNKKNTKQDKPQKLSQILLNILSKTAYNTKLHNVSYNIEPTNNKADIKITITDKITMGTTITTKSIQLKIPLSVIMYDDNEEFSSKNHEQSSSEKNIVPLFKFFMNEPKTMTMKINQINQIKYMDMWKGFFSVINMEEITNNSEFEDSQIVDDFIVRELISCVIYTCHDDLQKIQKAYHLSAQLPLTYDENEKYYDANEKYNKNYTLMAAAILEINKIEYENTNRNETNHNETNSDGSMTNRDGSMNIPNVLNFHQHQMKYETKRKKNKRTIARASIKSLINLLNPVNNISSDTDHKRDAHLQQLINKSDFDMLPEIILLMKNEKMQILALQANIEKRMLVCSEKKFISEDNRTEFMDEILQEVDNRQKTQYTYNTAEPVAVANNLSIAALVILAIPVIMVATAFAIDNISDVATVTVNADVPQNDFDNMLQEQLVHA